ncbi:WD40-repeat-containing protein [Cryptosporidium felis]|nr:WD40-repeat-containing protein [Cryptosporidium felis]
MQASSLNEGANPEDDIHTIWRRNCPYLYDTMLSYTLEWPTLTFDWLPNSYKSTDGSYSVHKVIYGTHTSGQDPNYLMIAEVHIGDLEANDNLMNNESFAEYSYNPENTNMNAVQFEVKAKLNHPEEVNKALHMPEHPFIIATRAVNGDILVFDYSKHESFPTDELVHPQLLLKGHVSEGYAMDWGKEALNTNHLISGGSDSVINVWDFNHTTSGIFNSSSRNHFNYRHDLSPESEGSCNLCPPTLAPVSSIFWHKSDVNDLKWHPSSRSVFGSVSDDASFALWDLRSSYKDPPVLYKTTTSGINALSFNKFVPTIISTGNIDGVVQIWDIRNTKEELYLLDFHSEKPIVTVEWSRWSPNILSSGGVDGKVVIWDLFKCSSQNIGSTQPLESNSENYRDNIAEIHQVNSTLDQTKMSQGLVHPNAIFIHYGHTAPITCLAWNPNDYGDPLLIASSSEDNTIQFWQFSDIYLNK